MNTNNGTWYNWRVIISATQEPAFVLRIDTQGPPTVGPNGEAIDTSQSRITDFKKDNSVQIQEMHTLTGKRYQIKHIKVAAAPGPGVVTTVDTTLPYDINLICVRNIITADMGGDNLSWLLAPNTIVGIITQNSSIGDRVFHVNGTVMSNSDISWRVRIMNSSNPLVYEDIGIITAFDRVNSTITLSSTATQTHTAGDYFAITGVYADRLELPASNLSLDMGLEIPKVAFVPAGRIVRCEYTNNSNTAKTFYCYYSFYYGDPSIM